MSLQAFIQAIVSEIGPSGPFAGLSPVDLAGMQATAIAELAMGPTDSLRCDRMREIAIAPTVRGIPVKASRRVDGGIVPIRNEQSADMLRPDYSDRVSRRDAGKVQTIRTFAPRTRDGSDPCERPIGSIHAPTHAERIQLRIAVLAWYNRQARNAQKRFKRGQLKLWIALCNHLTALGFTL